MLDIIVTCPVCGRRQFTSKNASPYCIHEGLARIGGVLVEVEHLVPMTIGPNSKYSLPNPPPLKETTDETPQ